MILDDIIGRVAQHSGRRLEGGADKLIGADHGCTGLDSIELLDEIEAIYRVDLRPYVESRMVQRKGWLGSYTEADLTPRELAGEIERLVGLGKFKSPLPSLPPYRPGLKDRLWRLFVIGLFAMTGLQLYLTLAR